MPLNITLEHAENVENIELEIDVQGWKGEGLVRLNDGWLSVHGALPNERLKVSVHPRPHPARRRADASIIEVLTPSPQRQNPHCDRFNICHGCQLRMVDWEAENRLKETKIKEIMLKFTGEEVFVDSIALPGFSRSDGLRMRAGLSQINGKLGLKTLGELIAMDQCPALTPRAQRMVQKVMAAICSDVHRVDVLAPEHGAALVTVHAETVDDSLKIIASEEIGIEVVNDHQVLFQGGPKHTQIMAGKHLLLAEGGAWVPASELASAPLYDWIAQRHFQGRLAIDLGCGIGGISAQLAANFDRVIGIDSDLAAMRSFSRNFPDTHVESLPGKFAKALQSLAQKGAKPNLITINPMREPLGTQTISIIRHLAPQSILYLGPSPTSASKDIKELLEMWDISTISQANVHPHTHHTMLIALLERKPE